MLLPRRLPGAASAPLPELEEMHTLLSENVQKWTGQQLAAALADVTDAGRLAQVGEWIIECGTAAELFARLAPREPEGKIVHWTLHGHRLPAHDRTERRGRRRRFRSEDVRGLPVANWEQESWRKPAPAAQPVCFQQVTATLAGLREDGRRA